jgi:hypothetical protein
MMKIAQMFNKLLNPALRVGDVSTRFSRSKYDKRRLPPLYFTQDYSVKNIHLFLKGEEYTPYMFNYQRMIDLMNEGVLSENEC